MSHIYTSPDGRADTDPEDLYEYSETVADDPSAGIEDQGTLGELISRHPILEWMQFDESLLYEPVILDLTIGLTNFKLRPLGWS